MKLVHRAPTLLLSVILGSVPAAAQSSLPNIVLIYADDLGYGDLSAYGATRIQTPNIDRIANEGLRFTRGHSAAATCTPSRYALLTGQYPWRRKGTNVLAGDAMLIVEPGRKTLGVLLQTAGYRTGYVGKWHLGLGGGEIDWNREIEPGPRQVGFEYSFLIPSTGDRVPTVFVEDQRVVGLEPEDPLHVSYQRPVGDEPTGATHPELLSLRVTKRDHDQTIVNGISRIGYMSGGKAARWADEDISDVITDKAIKFIERSSTERFFLIFATHDIHVPRVAHARFAGRSNLGPRGDVILQLDAAVGEILGTLDRLHLAQNTLVIFSSDNGPVLDDGYADEAQEKLNGHTPAGPLRGGKYTAYEGGTRVPLLVRWPMRVKHGISAALIGQIDLLASLAALTGQKLADDEAPDSFSMLAELLGEAAAGRDHLVEQGGSLALVERRWKYIAPPSPTGAFGRNTRELLYDLNADPGETNDVGAIYPERVAAMRARLEKIKSDARSRP